MVRTVQAHLSWAKGGRGEGMRPFVGIAWDGPKTGPPGGEPSGRMALVGKARTRAPGKTRTSNPQIRSLMSGSG